MKYKVGDRVKITSLDWYNKNKDEDGDVLCGDYEFVSYMTVFCGKILTIDVEFEDETYLMKEDIDGFVFTIEMIEGLAEEEMPLDKAGQITDFEYEGLAYTLPEGYQFVDENGNIINATKIVLEKKKKEYPTTYEECCKVLSLGEDGKLYTKGYKSSLIQNFQKLLICRDAYWKIAGDEMRLGKPWEPYWKDNSIKYTILYSADGIIFNDDISVNRILAFPTEEMRDAFYENFKSEIESCKELL